ncbi:hypothetical protein CVT91_05125 [Candidatus Atribacteria bacterium HGW-Atribacteria-1]|nr:MAG: hypothetical protein CVT91_05125 [Candidatus Atribacteria bacterium HGW-Atribacteria-1]
MKAKIFFVAVTVLLISLFSFIAGMAATSTTGEKSPDVLITSVGQSADARIIKVVADKLQLDCDFEQLAKPDIIKNYKILVIVVGGSSKGLGAAGIDKEQELVRAQGLIKEAKVRSVKILVMHVGGEARRGALSDAFLNEVVPYADHLIVVENGNKDGYFTRISKEKEIPIEFVTKILATGELMKGYFDKILQE